MSAIAYPHIEIADNGKAYIDRTGIKVRMLIERHLAGASVEELRRDYPQLSRSQVHSALAYYYDHQELLDREIAELEQAEKEIRSRLENRSTTEKLRRAMETRKGHP